MKVLAFETVARSNLRNQNALCSVSVSIRAGEHKETTVLNFTHDRESGNVLLSCGKMGKMPVTYGDEVVNCKTKSSFINWTKSQSFLSLGFLTSVVKKWDEFAFEKLTELRRQINAASVSVAKEDGVIWIRDKYSLLEELAETCTPFPRESRTGMLAVTKSRVDAFIAENYYVDYPSTVHEGRVVFFAGRKATVAKRDMEKALTYVRFHGDPYLTPLKETDELLSFKPSAASRVTFAKVLALKSIFYLGLDRDLPLPVQEVLASLNLSARTSQVSILNYGRVFGFRGETYYVSGEPDSSGMGLIEVTRFNDRSVTHIPCNSEVVHYISGVV